MLNQVENMEKIALLPRKFKLGDYLKKKKDHEFHLVA